MDAPPERRAGTTGQVKRRGLIAGAAALLAAGLAKLAEAAHKPTETTYDGQHVLHVDQVNTTASITEIRRSGSANVPALQVNNLANGGDGMVAATIGAGKAGVLGENNSAADSPGGLGGIGVLGHNSNTSPTTNSIGVQGFVLTPSSVGVQGINFANSASAVAAQGLSADGGVLLSGVGVHGKTGSGTGVRWEAATGIGVLGAATGASNASPGVYGAATQGYGVFGFSANSNGIAGQSGGSAAGCVGFAGAPGGYGIYGGIAVQGGYAGGFAGPVLVNGAFTVVNGPKNAAVPHPDGSHRLLYCLESPESWFEDFGEAKLVNGRATVALDKDFAAVVQTDRYQVFLTEYDDHNALYVTARRATGFEVRAKNGPGANGTFGYRAVAKRKDIPGPRKEKVNLHAVPAAPKGAHGFDQTEPKDLPKPPAPNSGRPIS